MPDCGRSGQSPTRPPTQPDVPTLSAYATPQSVPLLRAQWRSARTTNAIERLHEEFKRRIKTQTVLPSAETAAMLFIEHGRAPEPSIARLQDRLDRPWGMFAGGCHINRRIDALIRQSGFRIEHLAHDRMPGPRIYNYLYEGKARPE